MAEDERDERYDPKGERGGDTGKTDQVGKGEGAEKGDQRRDRPTHSGPTRQNTEHSRNVPGGRSGSQSNAKQ